MISDITNRQKSELCNDTSYGTSIDDGNTAGWN